MSASRPRSTSRRPRSEREPVLVRRDTIESPELEHGVRVDAMNWRYVSGLIVVTLAIIAFAILRSDVFTVRGITVSGISYLTTGEIFRHTGIAGQHILTVDPAAVQRTLLERPTIAEAEVMLNWPPDMVRIRIVEREPALLWDQNGVEAWVDIHGRVLTSPPEERPDLLRVTTRGIDAPISLNDTIPQDVVDGARQLRELVPAERSLRYDPFLGLGFRDDRGWDAWFGSGLDMPVKILVYQGIVNDLLGRGITPSIINVSNPDRPYCSGC